MALGIPVLALMGLANSFISGLGKVKALLAMTAVAAVVNVSLAFLLIPPLHARGAALANLGSQLFIGAITLVYIDRQLGHARVHPRTVVVNLIASTCGGLLAYLTIEAIGGVAGLVVGGAAGLAGFALVAAVIKVIRADDAHWLLASSSGTWIERPASLACRAFAPSDRPRTSGG